MTYEKTSFSRNVVWKKMRGYEGFDYKLLNVNRDNKIIEMLFRFEPEQKCFFHRHYHPTSTLVITGEQRIYEKNRKNGLLTLSKIRKAGEFGVSEGEETHIEGGGSMGGIIYQNIQVKNNIVYSILNSADLSVKIDVTFDNFYQDFLSDISASNDKIAI